MVLLPVRATKHLLRDPEGRKPSDSLALLRIDGQHLGVLNDVHNSSVIFEFLDFEMLLMRHVLCVLEDGFFNGAFEDQCFDEDLSETADSMCSLDDLGFETRAVDGVYDEDYAGGVEVQAQSTAGDVNEEHSDVWMFAEQLHIFRALSIVQVSCVYAVVDIEHFKCLGNVKSYAEFSQCLRFIGEKEIMYLYYHRRKR